MSTDSLAMTDGVPLASLTTLGLGGPARHLVDAADEATAIAASAWAQRQGLPLFVLGGGSNVVVADGGFAGVVLRIGIRGFGLAADGDRMLVRAAAGEPWDALVQTAVARDLGGIECLAGIPGLVGATPIQNVGAYGQEVSDTIRAVRVLDRATGAIGELAPEACEFGYRDSMFKRRPDAFVVLGVTFALVPGGAPALRYPELRAQVAVRFADRVVTLADVSQTVLALRRKKSMVIDPDDPNRRSVGSFFTNPVLTPAAAARVVERAIATGAVGAPSEVPQFPAADGLIKLSAGWLVEHAGFPRGLRRGAVGVSTNHALALVHHGGGSTGALLALAREIQDGVAARFGVTLLPEPVLLGTTWLA